MVNQFWSTNSKQFFMKTKSENFVLSSEVPWEPAGEGIKRQILGYDGQIMLVRVDFEKGSIGYGHAHYHSQSTYVVSGKFEFHVDGVKKTVEAGDGIYIQPDVFHGATCLEAGTLIDVFSPMRADFLEKK